MTKIKNRLLTRKIYITQSDFNRLKELIKDINFSSNTDDKCLKKLKEELDRAIIVESNKIPNNVITMNSKVCLEDIDSGKEMVYVLVYPACADIEQKKISILAPIGTAILGYKVGDIIEWKVPAGIIKLKVKKIIYQPEAAGDYHL